MPFDKRIEPKPGQESVWDYPRPPRLEDSSRHVQIVFNGVVIADTRRAKRVLETTHPPTYYIPAEDVKLDEYFQPSSARSTFCEWKGSATYYTIRVGEHSAIDAAWSYLNPTPAFEGLRGCIAVYPGRMDACYLDGEKVEAQPGDFYGGWITKEIVGPFKGAPGTMGW